MKTAFFGAASLALAITGLSTAAVAAEEGGSDPVATPGKDRGAFIAGAKVGGIVPFDGLGPFVLGTLEVGYVLPIMKRSFAGVIDVSYTAPSTTGEQSDPRVSGGTYSWTLTQKELVIQPTLMYRLTSLGRVVPYVGVGPRIYLLRSIVEAKAGSQVIGETIEQSTKVGVGLPLGAEFKLGPGALLGELLFEYGPLDHTATGSSHTAGGTLQLGYRLMI
jgi:hypothetical protein